MPEGMEGVIDAPITPVTPVEKSLDEQLEALANETKVSPEGKPKDGEGSSLEASQGDGPKTDDPILAKLDEIDPQPKEGEEKKETPAALTEDQQKIFEAVPDVKTAELLYNIAEGYQNFADAFTSGKFEDVDKMLSSFNPQAHEAFLEHVYSSNIDKWIERWVEEKEAEKAGAGPAMKGLTTLQKQVKQLEAQLADKKRSEESQSQAGRQDAVVRAYVGHIDSLFDQIEFAPADRPWITSEIHNRVAADPKVKAAINSGNPAAVNKIFAATVREYVQRDKAVADAKGSKLKAQEIKKAPLQSGASQVSDNLPDDIKAVPKGQEDAWMDRQLGKLKATLGRK